MRSSKQTKLAFTATLCVLGINRGMTGLSRKIVKFHRYTQRWRILAAGVFTATTLATAQAWGAAECPFKLNSAQNAAPNKLYLYFPLTSMQPFPPHCIAGTPACFEGVLNVSPLASFNSSSPVRPGLSYRGDYDKLKETIGNVVTDTYCEFNVQVKLTPTMPMPEPDRQTIIGIGADYAEVLNNGTYHGIWGFSQEIDIGDQIGQNYARVWAGTFNSKNGVIGAHGGGDNSELTGANLTDLARWAFSIGGTAAHEAGHTYGLQHDNPIFPKSPGETPVNIRPSETYPLLPGETQENANKRVVKGYIMAAGVDLEDQDRVKLRHFGDDAFSILAANVGLSIETIHNWDFVNPNDTAAKKVRIEVLSLDSKLTSVTPYTGEGSPWDAPMVSPNPLDCPARPASTNPADPQTPYDKCHIQNSDKKYNRFYVTWSAGKAWKEVGTSADMLPGHVPPGKRFHIGTGFMGVNFTKQNPVIITEVTLFGENNVLLPLKPRMIGYDTGLFNINTGGFGMNFFNPDNLASPLIVRDVVVRELPRVASIESMVQGARLETWQGLPITPWKTEHPKLCGGTNRITSHYWWEYWAMYWGENEGEKWREHGGTHGGTNCVVKGTDNPLAVPAGKLANDRHIFRQYDGKCLDGSPGDGAHDSSKPGFNECPNAGISIGLFPSTILYVTATIFDPATKQESHLYYQFAGKHPDLNLNDIDDFIDIINGTSEDSNGDGVPDEAQRCQHDLREFEACETKRNNLKLSLADIEREEQHCHGLHCIWLEIREHILRMWFRHQAHECEEELREFKQCMNQ